ncbi:MAG: transposase [Planctomycetaceae bacterium]|nr:transposase [Planctomycetaceae bacterium]
MPRAARLVIPDCPHHVVQRGNNKQDVFFSDDDRRYYLRSLKQCAREYGLNVVAYALMCNHVHLVVVPKSVESLAKGIGRTNFFYTRHVNALQGRCGHLWQDRFFSSPLDESYFWNAMVYVERNPVRAGIVSAAWDYPWSSAAAHCNNHDLTGLLDMQTWRSVQPPEGSWHESLAEGLDEQTELKVRSFSSRGLPLGSDSFVSKLESDLERRLRPAEMGRPRKQKVGTLTTFQGPASQA